MSLSSVLRKGMKLLDKQTSSLQDTITFYPWIGVGNYAEPVYDVPITMKALVEEKQVNRRTSDGKEIVQRAMITIPRPIAPNGATDRREPIDLRDKIILSNGYTGPILHVEGTMDSSTQACYSYDIALG